MTVVRQSLSAYNYSIAYKSGADHSNADLLSRLPLSESVSNVPLPGETVLLMETLQGSPVSCTNKSMDRQRSNFEQSEKSGTERMAGHESRFSSSL